MNAVAENVKRVRERVDAALRRAGRADDAVTLVGITKTFDASMVDALVDAGIDDIGENRVQEFLDKRENVCARCRWHMVGHLQRNKATKVVGQFHRIHSVDSVRLARTLSRYSSEAQRTTDVYVQVNTSGEPAKSGFSVEETIDRAGEIIALPGLQVHGFMTIGPYSMDPAATRACFRTLFQLRGRAADSLGEPFAELSMGMSGDFEIALEEGATVIRLGRVLTGERTR